MPKIGIGLQSVGLGGLDQRVQIGTGLDTFDRVTEQPVLAPEHERADGILRTIVVDLQPIIIQVSTRSFSMNAIYLIRPKRHWSNE